MKNFKGIVCLLLLAHGLYAQTLFVPNGVVGTSTHSSRVGIGLNTPLFRFHIAGQDIFLNNGTQNSSLHFRTDGNGNAFINNMNNFANNGTTGNGFLALTGQSMLRFSVGNAGTSGAEKMRITDSGIGIGTTVPYEKFQIGDRWTFHDGGDKVIGYNYKYDGTAKRIVNKQVAIMRYTGDGRIQFEVAPTGAADSDIEFATALTINNGGHVQWGTRGLLKRDQGASLELGGAGRPYIDFTNDTDTDYDARFILTGDDQLTLAGANLLVGKSTQTNSAYKIDVAGKVRTDEIVVNTDGADHVFDPSYELTSLDTLEAYVREHHHLPGIAPAAEMQREGMAVGVTTTKLLEKVEELTLYVINLKKENREQEALMKELMLLIGRQQEQIERLQKENK